MKANEIIDYLRSLKTVVDSIPNPCRQCSHCLINRTVNNYTHWIHGLWCNRNGNFEQSWWGNLNCPSFQPVSEAKVASDLPPDSQGE